MKFKKKNRSADNFQSFLKNQLFALLLFYALKLMMFLQVQKRLHEIIKNNERLNHHNI